MSVYNVVNLIAVLRFPVYANSSRVSATARRFSQGTSTGSEIENRTRVFLTDNTTDVLMESNASPAVTVHRFGKGYGVYLSSFSKGAENARLLQNLILFTCGEELTQNYMADDPHIDTAYYPDANTLVLANSSSRDIETSVKLETGIKTFSVPAYETVFAEL